jgi:hypothetical protein
VAHHFLWAYPKNAKLLASTFKHIASETHEERRAIPQLLELEACG